MRETGRGRNTVPSYLSSQVLVDDRGLLAPGRQVAIRRTEGDAWGLEANSETATDAVHDELFEGVG